MEKLKILLPKGRIYENVNALFAGAGINIRVPERSYRPFVNQDDLDVKIMKPQNIGKLLELGAHDCGFTGLDWTIETNADVEKIMELHFDKVNIVAAVPNEIDDTMLRQKRIIVATEYENIAKEWLKTAGYNAFVVRTYGATEVFPPDDADMIIDNTSTGRTLKENGLRIVDTLMTSGTCMFASHEAMKNEQKRKKILELKMLFEGVLDAREMVMLEMNVSSDDFSRLVGALPSMKSPTVSPLYTQNEDSNQPQKSGYAVKIAVKRKDVPILLPRLKNLGATDILEYELRKVIG